MKITLLGATGFVGRILLARLAQEGHQLTVLSRNPHAHLVRLLPPVPTPSSTSSASSTNRATTAAASTAPTWR